MTDTLQETTLLHRVADGLFIGGEWVEAEGGKTLAVTDPATGETIMRPVPSGLSPYRPVMRTASSLNQRRNSPP